MLITGMEPGLLNQVPSSVPLAADSVRMSHSNRCVNHDQLMPTSAGHLGASAPSRIIGLPNQCVTMKQDLAAPVVLLHREGIEEGGAELS